MNPSLNRAITAERMRTLQAGATTASVVGPTRGRHRLRNDDQDNGGTVKYIMLVCADESIELSPEEGAQMGPATEAWVEEMDRRGIRLQGDRLRPVSDATTVAVRGGEVMIADGPFAETKEQIAGYDIIDCADLDEALNVAAKHPVARFGKIEVRPFWTD